MKGAGGRGILPIFAIACALSGCGAFVPEIEEFWSSPGDVSIKVNAIESQVKCELRESVRALLAEDAALSRQYGTPRQLTWLNDWAAQVTLTLTILETTAFNPGLSLNTPLNNAATTYGATTITVPQSYSFGLGGTLSSNATRIDTITSIYNLRDFANGSPSDRTCIPAQPANADLFIQSDLKLKQWLYEAMLPQYTGIVKYPDKPNPDVKNVISHEVKFEIVSSGNATPTWKLIRVSANTGSSPLFGTSRDRTQDLLITLGPTTQNKMVGGPPTLSTAAQNSHLASQIGLAVAASVRAPQ